MGKRRDKPRRKARKEELGDLVRAYLKQLGNPPIPGEPDAPVNASLKPKPHPQSGAIAVPEPEPEEDFVFTQPVRNSK